jgi:hypothetical protein
VPGRRHRGRLLGVRDGAPRRGRGDSDRRAARAAGLAGALGAEDQEHRLDAGAGFDIAHEAFDSGVLWREQSVYDLTPESIGEFDFIFVGSLLGHVRDPVAALAAISCVLRGEMLSVDFISAQLTLRHPLQPVAQLEAEGWPLWWVPNLRAYRQLFGAAKLEIIASGRPFFVKRGRGYSGAYDQEDARESPLTRIRHTVSGQLGNLHAWVRAQRSVAPAEGDGALR